MDPYERKRCAEYFEAARKARKSKESGFLSTLCDAMAKVEPEDWAGAVACYEMMAGFSDIEAGQDDRWEALVELADSISTRHRSARKLAACVLFELERRAREKADLGES